MYTGSAEGFTLPGSSPKTDNISSSSEYSLPPGVVGRFAVVKLWPEIKTAEDECIARLKLAAAALGVECIEVLADGTVLSGGEGRVSRSNVDFVVHLHYDTPKLYDAFSFVALWNPLKFYHEWGYQRCSRNLTTHDDFLSCSSQAADDHVARMIRSAGTHLEPHFRLYHSTPDIVHEPTLGEGKLFYAGINWEAINGGKSRHQEVLKRLDGTGLLRIYGPQVFQGVKVWDGYQSYVREVPFDGVSMLDEISRAGIALVLSSAAHKESGLMSNRLFESVAAGALVICDENPFARRFFGDSLLYIDTRTSAEQILANVTRHLEWVGRHPDQTLDMIGRAQSIFRERFTLIGNLRTLYDGFAERKAALAARAGVSEEPSARVKLFMLMPEYSESLLREHIDSVRIQDYGALEPVLVVDQRTAELFADDIAAQAVLSPLPIAVRGVAFAEVEPGSGVARRRRLGEVMLELIRDLDADAFAFVGPSERLFSNHVSTLAAGLRRNQAAGCAATAAILKNGAAPIHHVHELIDFGHVDRLGPLGYGRFLFRTAAVREDIALALPYLDGRPLAVLVADNVVEQQLAATIVIDVEQEFPPRTWDEVAENEVIRDYAPEAFRLRCGFGPRPQAATVRAGGEPAPQPAAVPATSLLQLFQRSLNPRWLAMQWRLIRSTGLRSRLKLLKTRLAS